MKKLMISLALCAVTAFYGIANADNSVTNLIKGNPIPTATLSDLEGKDFSLQNVKSPVLFTIFTTWCAVCKKELTQLNSEYPSVQQKNINVIAINAGEKLSTVKKYSNRMKIDYPVYVDPELKLVKSIKVTGTPTILIFNKEAKLVYQGNELPDKWTDLVK